MRIAFMGTPDFACPSLEALCREGHEIVGVFCQPDRPQGRKQQLTPCEVKLCALGLGLPVYQFEKLRRQQGLDALRACKPDLCVTAAFGQILSQKLLDVPPLGTVNVHGSLLPKYRGASPIQQAVINGERETGITTMYTAREMDAGDIILQRVTPIGEDETAGELFDRLAVLGAQVLVDTVRLIAEGRAPRTPQKADEATFCKRIEKSDGLIDFRIGTRLVLSHIRGMDPWPVAFAMLNGSPLKVYKASRAQGVGAPGQILCADPKRGLIVGCGDGAVSLDVVQLPGGRPLEARLFLIGHDISEAHLEGKE